MKESAIIILDMQNSFITKENKNLAKKIKKHLASKKYDFIIFSKFTNKSKSNFVKRLHWNKCKDSSKERIVPELFEISQKNKVFEKNTYSIFKSKPFMKFLKKNGISELYFCGLDLDACILASCFDAFDLGFDFKILTHLTGCLPKADLKYCSKRIIRRNLSFD